MDNVNNEYLDTMLENGFKSFINVYIRTPAGMKHSCLDHIFFKNERNLNLKIEAGVIQTNITDHFSTIMTIEINNKKKEFTNKNVKIINYKKLNEKFKNEMWTEVFNSSDVNNSVKIFINKVSQIIFNNDSSTTIKLENSKNKKIKEWMTQGLLCFVRHKQELSIKVTKHPKNAKLVSYHHKYKNKFTTILRAAKNTYFKNKFNKVPYSPKLTWKVINEITGKHISNKEDISHVKVNNKV